MRLRAAALALIVATPALAAAPSLKDFAAGLSLKAGGNQPVQQLTVPDAVYDGVTRADLGDLRVFNSAGIVVPHALCTAPALLPASTSDAPLTVFALSAAREPGAASHSEIQVQSANGARVTIREPQLAAQANSAIVPGRVAAWVVDAGPQPGMIRALKFSWTTADGASELSVRVDASDDLMAWRTIVPQATLLRIAADGRVLERTSVDLPPGSYRYLRVERSGQGPPPRIHGVTAEVELPAREPEPFRFAAEPLPETVDGAFLFETGRLAPVHTASVLLPAPNMSIEAGLDSRAAPEAPWQRRWRGRVSSIQPGGAPATATAAAFAPVTDSYWRVVVLGGRETLGTSRPSLTFGYHPARLQFMAQGEGPWILAFGSARVSRAEPAACNALLGGLPAAELGQAMFEPAPDGRFGGAEAYVVPPMPTPVRQIVLWAVLVVGTGLLLVMALSLRRRLSLPAE